MKKITLLIALFVLSSWQLSAQISMGTGTTTGQGMPIEPYYGYSYSQVIYHASDIGAAGSITGVKYYATSATTLANSSSWTVYIGHTTKTEFSSNTDWEPISGLTQVFSGTATIANGEVLITFSAAFAYNGTDNLVIAVDENTSSFDGSTHDFYCSSAAGYQGIMYRNDNTNPNPTSPPSASYRRQYIANVELQGITITCPKPDTLVTSAITASSATIGWSEMGSATSWNVQYTPDGGMSVMDTIVSVNPLTLTNLFSGTNYLYRVRAVCGVNDSSAWANPGAFTTPCASALSGSYTVNSSVAASATNFQTMGEAVDAINICGVSGAVVINVVASTDTLMGPWDFGAITGASATNTVTLNGNNNLVYKNLAENHFVRMDGTKHLILNNFNFVNQTPSSNMFGIQMMNACDSITISNNTINVGMDYTTSSSGGIVASNSTTSASSSGNNANNVLISNNEIIGGYYGVRINGTGSTNKTMGHAIMNNNIHDFYAYGTYLNYADSVFVEGNDLSRNVRTNGYSFYGVYANYATHCSIKKNKIHDAGSTTSSVYGIQLRYSSNSVGSESEITNNAIYNVAGSSSGYGIYMYGTKSNINIYHNTIDIETAGTSSKYGFYTNSAITDVNIKNNLISIHGMGTGSAYGMYINTNSATTVPDYNNVFVNSSGTNYYGKWGSNRSTLADFQTASSQAANSSESDPVLTDVANGNYTPLSMAIDNMGAVLGVTTDISGAARSATTPDVGALEFTGIPGDLAMSQLMLAQVSKCYGSADTAFAKVSNILATASDFTTNPLTIVWNVTGPVNSMDSLVVSSGSLAGNSDSIFYISSIDMSVPGDYWVSAYIKPNTVNPVATNDTIMNGYMETVAPILVASPDTIMITSPWDSARFSTQSPLYAASSPFITERGQYSSSTYAGVPSPTIPAYIVNYADYVEITGVPNSNLEGYTYELWASTSKRITHVFSASETFNSSGTMVLGTYYGTTSAADHFYKTAVSYDNGSGTASGHIIKDPQGNIVDAFGYGSYSFPASSGVTSADWSGITVSGQSSWGLRLEGPDMNNNTGWSKSSNSNRQDPNVVNASVTVPSAPSIAGLTWDSAGTTVGTDPTFFGGPYNADGVHTYVVSFASSCGTYMDTVVVSVDLTKAMISDSTMVTCNGAANGTATVTASGGDAPYTYMWSNGDVTAMADSLAPGTYTVTVNDANMWPATATVIITEPVSLAATTSTTPSTCGVPSGSATVATTGGTTPYTYSWSDGQTTATAASLVGGGYTVTITDANLCTYVTSATVSDIGAPSISIAVDSIVACYGGSTGVVTASATGGSTPYAFAWSSGGTAATENGLPVGTYDVTLTDASGCVATENVVMTQNTPLLAIVTGSTNPLCNGDATGTATSIAGGGVAPYSYAWSNGDVTANAASLAAGSHTLTVTDNVGCMQTASVSIIQPNQLSGVFVNVMDVSCNAGTNGSAGILNSGGTAPYSMSWSNGSTTSSATGLSAGYVAVTVTDANACVMMDSVNITEPTAVTSTATVTSNVLCNGGNSGMATVVAAGGTSPFVYAWSNGSGGSLANGLAAGTYSVTVSDGNNCQATNSVTITEPTALALSVSGVDISCNGMNDGSITTTASGGTSPYSYAWSNGASTSGLTNLGAGVFSVDVTDANGCMTSDFASISEPAAVVVDLGSARILCDGESMILDAGAGFSSYVWTSGNSSQMDTVTAANLGVGTFNVGVMVTDGNGCMGDDSVDVSVSAPVVTSIVGAASLCSYETGSLDAGPGFSSYSWSNNSSSQLINVYAVDYPAGNHVFTVTVTDANGCAGEAMDTVIIHPEVMVDLGADTVVWKESPYIIMADSGYASYLWNTGATTQNLEVTTAGTYSLMVTDSTTGCAGEDDIQIDFVLSNGDFSAASLRLYPNPAVNNIYIDFANFAHQGIVEVQVISITGQLVRTYNVDVSGNNGTASLDVSKLATGTYMVKFEYEGQNIVKQFTIK
tara:strand:+ start:42133 stop:48060 length:5928 start_codon:yes stop_codon:yes gene_type:complete